MNVSRTRIYNMHDPNALKSSQKLAFRKPSTRNLFFDQHSVQPTYTSVQETIHPES